MTFNSFNHLIHHTRERIRASRAASRRHGAASPGRCRRPPARRGHRASAPAPAVAGTAHLRHQAAQPAGPARRHPRPGPARAQRPGRAPGRTAGRGQPAQRPRRTPDPQRPAGRRRVRFRQAGRRRRRRPDPRHAARASCAAAWTSWSRSSRRPASSCRCWSRCCSTASWTQDATAVARCRSPTATSPPASAAAPIRSAAARAFHKGIDFHANTGDPVLAVADGVVSYAGVRSGYGNVVEIDHGNGYVTRYAHNSRLLVQVGDLVRSGQQVAKAGSTGRSTGAHVHFEVWVNGVGRQSAQVPRAGGRHAKRGLIRRRRAPRRRLDGALQLARRGGAPRYNACCHKKGAMRPFLLPESRGRCVGPGFPLHPIRYLNVQSLAYQRLRQP